jgi:hypothetical protein
MKMAVIRRARNRKFVDQRWAGDWRPSSEQVGSAIGKILLGTAAAGGLGYMYVNYPRTFKKYLQKGVHAIPKFLETYFSAKSPEEKQQEYVKQALGTIFPFGAEVKQQPSLLVG